jgi:hypothetical protein
MVAPPDYSALAIGAMRGEMAALFLSWTGRNMTGRIKGYLPLPGDHPKTMRRHSILLRMEVTQGIPEYKNGCTLIALSWSECQFEKTTRMQITSDDAHTRVKRM